MTHKFSKKIAVLLAGFLLFASVGMAFGQGGGQTTNPVRVTNPAPNYILGDSDLGNLVVRAIDWLLYISGALAVVFLLVGGFQYVAARGNEEASAKAKKTILGAVIGLTVVIMAYAIVYIVNTLITRDPDENALHKPATIVSASITLFQPKP